MDCLVRWLLSVSGDVPFTYKLRRYRRNITAGLDEAENHLRREELRKDEYLAEPFIWATFLSLATAGLLMEQGTTGSALSPWAQIAHLDMKPANVFLADSSKHRFRGYKTPKLVCY